MTRHPQPAAMDEPEEDDLFDGASPASSELRLRLLEAYGRESAAVPGDAA